MAVAVLNEKTYGKLLLHTLPRVITSDSENERLIAELERLDHSARPLAPEQKTLAELITVLIEHYEQHRYPLGHAEPVEALRAIMEDRGLRQRDLIPVFGSSSVVSDVLNGKRGISKAHARKLAEFLHMPVSLFV